MAFFTLNKAKLYKKLTITLVFEKNANFLTKIGRKSPKIVIITSAPGRNSWWSFSVLLCLANLCCQEVSKSIRKNSLPVDFLLRFSFSPGLPDGVFSNHLGKF
jgi:hypothetical protein